MAVALPRRSTPAVVLGIIFLFYLPDSPAHAAWLTPSERSAILSLVPRPRPADIRIHPPTLRHPRVWLLGIFMFCMLASNYAYVFTAPVILQKATGFSITRVGFLIAAMNSSPPPA